MEFASAPVAAETQTRDSWSEETRKNGLGLVEGRPDPAGSKIGCFNHASALTAAAEIQPIEFQNWQAVPIRCLAFLPVHGRPHPVSGSMFQWGIE